MKNAGKYNKKIVIYRTIWVEDEDGFQHQEREIILTPKAQVKTTRGMTIIKNNSDFEKAYTNFTIRYPRRKKITRDMMIDYRGVDYSIEYLNNVDEANIDLEIQAKEVTH